MSQASGPLCGLKVLEIAGIGPAPFCAMMLADMGADVVRVERAHAPERGIPVAPRFDVLNRGRRSIALDLKSDDGVKTLLDLVARADVMLEGFRPGVMERLGAGPAECLAANPRLVYGRMTGFGQDGPLSAAAGHDLNYIALTGVLGSIGAPDKEPVVPLNLIGDFGGGGMLLTVGLLAAYVEAQRSGQGQVVDAAMTDGSALLMASTYGLKAAGAWQSGRGTNVLDGGAPWYGVYVTADGHHVSLAALEPRFYDELIRRLGLAELALPPRSDRARWPELRARLAGCMLQKTRAEWQDLLEGTDVCFAPVLTMDEAPLHPHNVARGTFIDIAGVKQPAPAPRFARTPSRVQHPPPAPGEHTEEILRGW
ncbi:MAG: CoA transferase [Comamonadaceae bacterium]|nr:MAG: CoA transferase [Comamonadaceae bacterium]